MINLFEFIVNIVEMSMVLLFLTFYFGCKYKGWKKIIGFLAGLIIAVGTISYLNSLYIYEGVLGLIFVLIYFTYSIIFLNGDIYTKLFISGFINCIVYFISLFSTLCMAGFFTDEINKLYSMTEERVFTIILTKILLFIACVILLKFKLNNIANKKNMLIIIIMTIVSDLSMVGIMNVFLEHSELKKELLLATISVILADVLIYYVFIKINTDAKIESESNALIQQYENDRSHAQEIEELYSKTCAIRHELIHHFETLKSFLDSDVEKAKEYIQNISDNQLNSIINFVKTDNNCFDAIVNTKIALCEKCNIDVQTRIMNGVLDRLRNDEIAVIFGNLFDNAIEAAKKSNEKIIELEVQKQGEYLAVCMKNSIDRSVLESNPDLETTKGDKRNHGYGTKNIKQILKEHDGMIDYVEEDKYFCCYLYF